MPAGLTSPVHLFIIIFVALIVLGPEKLPHAMRQAGRTMGSVRRWSDSISAEVRGALSLDTDDGVSTEPSTVLAAPAASAGGPGTNGKPFPHSALQEGGEWH